MSFHGAEGGVDVVRVRQDAGDHGSAVDVHARHERNLVSLPAPDTLHAVPNLPPCDGGQQLEHLCRGSLSRPSAVQGAKEHLPVVSRWSMRVTRTIASFSSSSSIHGMHATASSRGSIAFSSESRSFLSPSFKKICGIAPSSV